MAEYSDGSIVIDTEINPEGFMKDSKKLNSAITSLVNQVNRLGRDVTKALSKGTPAAIESLRQKFAQTGQDIAGMREKLGAIADVQIKTDKYIELCAEVDKAEKALQRLQEREAKLKDSGADQSSVKWQQLQNDIDETTSKLEFYKKGLAEAQAFLKDLQSPEWMNEAQAGGPEAWEDYQNSIRNAKQEIAENAAEVQKLEAALTKLIQKQEQMKASGADQGSLQWRNLQYDIEQAKSKLEEFNERKARMENSGESTIRFGDTAEFQNMENNLDRAGNKLDTFKSKLANGSAGNAFKNVLLKIGAAAGQALVNLNKMVSRAVVNGFKALYSNAWKATKAIMGLGTSAKKSNKGIKGGLMNILKYGLGIRSVFVLVNKLRSAIKESFESIAKIDAPTNKAISSVISALGQLKNSLGAAFQPIVTAIAPYLTQLISMLSAAINKIGEFFAALTGQKYYLKATKVQTDYAKSLDKTTKATKKANQAQRQLAGFDELNVLSANSSGGGGSSDNTTDPSKMFEKVPLTGVSDFFKRIKEAFANGDYEGIGRIVAEKINAIFQKINDAISWDKIGPTITKYVNMICGVFNGLIDGIDWSLIGSTIGNGLNSLINTIYLLITGINWTELGTSIGEGLTALLEQIDWETFGATLAEAMTIKLQLLAAAILAFDWEALGSDLAKGLNSFVTTITDTIEGIDWVEMATSMANGLNSFVTDIDWVGVGNLIGEWVADVAEFITTAITSIDWATLVAGVATGFDSIVSKISEAVASIDWVALGESIVAGLNGLVNDPDWEGFGVTLGELFNGLLSTFLTILTEFDWAGLGASLAEYVMGLCNTVNWAGIAETISAEITGILTAANEFILGLDPETIVTAIEEFLSGVDWAGIASKLFELLGAALGTLGAVIGGLIRDAFIGIETYFTEEINACGGNVVAGILKGILDALVGIVTWIDENIFTPFINGIMKAFGFEEGSGSSHLLVDFGTAIINSIAEGISALWDTISGFFSDAWTNITTFFTEADVGTWFTENVWAKIQGAFSSVGEWFKTTAGNMWSGITTYFTDLGDGIGTWFTENVWNKITGVFSGVGDWFKTTAGSMWGGITSFFTELGEKGIVTWFTENVWDKITSVFTGVKDWFKGVASNIWDGLTGGLSETVEDVKEKVTGFFSNVWGGVLNFFGIHSPSETAASAGKNLLDGFSEGAEEEQESAGTRLSNVFSGIYNAAKGVWDSVTGWLGKLFGGGKESKETKETKKAAGEVAGGITEAFKGVETSISKPIEDGVSAGMTAFTSLKTSAETSATGVETAFTTMGTNVDTALTTLNTNITDKSTAFTEKLSAVSEAVTAAKKTVTDSVTAIKTTITLAVTTINSTITTKVASIKTTVSNGFTAVKNSITNNTSQAMNAVSNQNWASIGSNIVSGIQRGINNGWSWLQNTVWNLAQSLYRTARNALGIHSPSRMFRDGVGVMLGLGVAEGMEDSQPKILESVSSVADAIAEEMRGADATAQLGVNSNSLLDGLDGILSRFSDKITDSFTAMLDKLNAIAETVTFRTPAVAEGGIIPYSAAARVESSADTISDYLETSNDEIIDAMIQTVTNATTAIVEAIQRYNGNSDKKITSRDVTDIIDEINRRTRRQGNSPLLI